MAVSAVANNKSDRETSLAVATRVPALDGLRGFALLGMMAWHAQVSWVKGGFARMTVFFVLAGYLATRSALRSREAYGGREGSRNAVSGGFNFWARRARRLLPVTAIGALISVLVTVVVGTASSAGSTFWDALATLTSWENWRLVVTGQRYSALFEDPSAFQHFWSLSVEEQCFILTPLILAAVLWITGRNTTGDGSSRWGPRSARVLAGMAVVLCALPLVWVQSPDAVYYGTHVRLGEFLAGMALAVMVAAWPEGRATTRLLCAARFAGPMGLAVLILVMATIPRDQEWIYRGGMGLMVIPVLAVVVAALVHEPVTTAILSIRPLTWVGRAAFSIYVLHWPWFLLVDHLNGGPPQGPVSTWLVDSAKFGGAFILGGLLNRYYERPLMGAGREGARTKPLGLSPMTWTVGLGAAALAAAALVPPTASAIDFTAAQTRANELIDATASTTDSADRGALPTDKTRVLVYGGSSAMMDGLGGGLWASRDQKNRPIFGRGYTELGCGLIVDLRVDVDEVTSTPDDLNVVKVEEPCASWPRRWRDAAIEDRSQDPDANVVALLVASHWDLRDRVSEDGSARWVPGDEEFDKELRRQVRKAIDAQVDSGTDLVAFMLFGPADRRWPQDRRREFERRAREYERVVERVVQAAKSDGSERSPRIEILRPEEWTDTLEPGEFDTLSPDGVHFSEAGAERMWAEWLWPELQELGVTA